MFPLFLKRTAHVLSPRLIIVFPRGSLPVCWRQTNVAAILKDSSSTSIENYQPISITAVLSKVIESLFASLGRFLKRSGVLSTSRFTYVNRLETRDALFVGPIHCKIHLRVGRWQGLLS